MHELNAREMAQVAGGNDPIFDSPIGQIFRNFRNAGASVSSSVFQTARMTGAWIGGSAIAGWTVGSYIYDNLPRDVQDAIGATITIGIDNTAGGFLNHGH